MAKGRSIRRRQHPASQGLRGRGHRRSPVEGASRRSSTTWSVHHGQRRSRRRGCRWRSSHRRSCRMRSSCSRCRTAFRGCVHSCQRHSSRSQRWWRSCCSWRAPPCANLLLARSTARTRRPPSGSPWRQSWRLLQQSLVESALLATLGGVAGWVAGPSSSGLLATAFLATSRDRLPEVYSPMRAYSSSHWPCRLRPPCCVVCCRPFMARADTTSGLVGPLRSSASPAAMRGMRPLVAAQLALAVVVVFSAALLGRSFVNFARIDPGYDTDHVVSVSFNPAASGYPADRCEALRTRLVIPRRPFQVSRRRVLEVRMLDNCTYSSSSVLDGDRARGEIDLDENHVGPAGTSPRRGSR